MREHRIDVKLGRDTFRLIFPYRYDHGAPVILISRRGPNGSPAGYGPKGFPKWMMKKGWGFVRVPLPFVSWGWGYRHRRIGGRYIAKFFAKVYA